MRKILVGVMFAMLTACGGGSSQALSSPLIILDHASAFIVASLVGVILSAIPLLFDTAKTKWKKSCEKNIRGGLITADLSWDDLHHLAERWHLNRAELLAVLRSLHALAVSGEDEALTKRLPEIRSLLKQHQEHEPYSDLPENIGIQLEALTMAAPLQTILVHQLATSLNDLYLTTRQKISKQEKIAFWSLIVGIAGFILAIVSIYLSFSISY